MLPGGERVRYDYDERQNLTRVRFANGTARRYHYEDTIWPSHLTGLTDRTGARQASWRYDETGRAIVSEHAGGVERVELEFHAPEDSGGAVGDIGYTIATATDGARTTYRWRRHLATGASLILEATGPGCATCPPSARRYTYSNGGRLESMTRLDTEGVEIARRRFEHDAHGRLTRVTDTLYDEHGNAFERPFERREYGGTRSDDATDGESEPGLPFSWRPTLVAGSSVRDGEERVLEIEYDADGLPVAMSERGFAPDEAAHPTNGADATSDWRVITRTTRLGYERGRLVSIDGPREDVEDVTRLEWDEHVRLVAIHPPAAPSVRFLAFDAHGRPASIRIGHRTPFTLRHDGNGNVIEVRQGGNGVRYEYDAEERLVSVTDAFGRAITLAHDAAGRLSSVRDDLGRVTRLVHDLENRIVRRTLSGIDGVIVKSLEQVLDANGRITGSRETLSSEREDGAASIHELVLADSEPERRVTVSDRSGRSRVTADLDPHDRSIVIERGDRDRSIVRFDALGQDIAFTDARGNETRFPRDDFGRVTLVDSPDTGRVRYRHDPAGNRVEARHEDGRVVRLAYDAAGRMISRNYDDATDTTRWTWNETTGDLVEVANATSTERFAYDDSLNATDAVKYPAR